MKKSRLKKLGQSDVALAKRRIQALLREVVIARDAGCFLRHYSQAGACGGYASDGHLILQADHLNTRARNISYGDERLAVCACQRHHIFWKPQHPDEYMRLARKFIGPQRAKLLDAVIADRRSYHYVLHDWLIIESVLRTKVDEQKYESKGFAA